MNDKGQTEGQLKDLAYLEQFDHRLNWLREVQADHRHTIAGYTAITRHLIRHQAIAEALLFAERGLASLNTRVVPSEARPEPYLLISWEAELYEVIAICHYKLKDHHQAYMYFWCP